MEQTVELRVLELICSRLCHELISPVTAVNNGMELLADGGSDMLEEVSDLIATSAKETSGRLQYYRIAYGLGGQDAPPISIGEARRLTEGILGDGKVTVEWPSLEAGTDGGLGRRGMKLLLNALILAVEALPRGGKLTLALTPGASPAVAITAAGKGARVEPASLDALNGTAPVAQLNARNVHAYFTARVAEAAGSALDVAPGADQVAIRFAVGKPA